MNILSIAINYLASLNKEQVKKILKANAIDRVNSKEKRKHTKDVNFLVKMIPVQFVPMLKTGNCETLKAFLDKADSLLMENGLNIGDDIAKIIANTNDTFTVFSSFLLGLQRQFVVFKGDSNAVIESKVDNFIRLFNILSALDFSNNN